MGFIPVFEGGVRVPFVDLASFDVCAPATCAHHMCGQVNLVAEDLCDICSDVIDETEVVDDRRPGLGHGIVHFNCLDEELALLEAQEERQGVGVAA